MYRREYINIAPRAYAYTYARFGAGDLSRGINVMRVQNSIKTCSRVNITHANIGRILIAQKNIVGTINAK